jgi:Zn-dependent protease
LKCEFCGADESLPFVCNYCGGVFCPDHRLPEAHMCKGDLSQKRTVVAPPTTTFTWSQPGYTAPMQGRGRVFSAVEVRDILVAWVALGVAFTIAISSHGFDLANLGYASEAFATSLVTVGSGFVLHELSHKFTAERYGYWAEFRVWPLGLVLALVTSFIGFIFAAPGATYISGVNISESENGKISLAGPLTNVAVAVAFLPLFLFGGSLGEFWARLGSEGVYINVFLALFNMLPVLPLDGAKVFVWNKLRWASVFVPLALVFVLFLLG